MALGEAQQAATLGWRPIVNPREIAYNYLELAIQREAGRHASLEQRLVGVMSAYTAVIAAAIALAAIVETDTPVSEGAPLALLVFAAILTVSGLAACVVGLFPLALDDPTDDDLRKLPQLAKDESVEHPNSLEGLTDLSESLADELISSRSATSVKAIVLVVAAISFAGTLLALSSALVIAL